VNPAITQNPLSYVHRLERRSIGDIDLVVIHCTELPDLPMARQWGEKIHHPQTRTGNSGHFYIDRDGRTEQWVPLEHVAHHVRGFNPRSIGIELVNTGRYPNWFHSDHQQMTEPYPGLQIDALSKLLNQLEEQLSGLRNITGHSDIDTGMLHSDDQPDTMIRRKVDPGPLFPWSQLMAKISLKRLLAEEL
jgi:N-acetylmuramoyl-L-alanine amidase